MNDVKINAGANKMLFNKDQRNVYERPQIEMVRFSKNDILTESVDSLDFVGQMDDWTNN